MEELIRLSDLIRQKNSIEREITSIIGRPALIGHVGEYIASKIFQIDLEESASKKAIDGYFLNSNLKGKSVNIKFYSKNERMLDITPLCLPDFYLVLTGDSRVSSSSKGVVKPWCISNAYLFESVELMDRLKQRNIKIGTATSVLKSYWDEAELFPLSMNQCLRLSEEQRALLELFRL